jgi:hypothetical protein
MRRLLVYLVLVAGCGDNAKALRDDAGVGPGDGASDGSSARLTGCLETPDLGGPPADRLPCDLVPPGLQL